MFAVIKTGGKQYRAKEGDVLKIEKIQGEQGKKVTFDEVLLVEDNDKILIGQPFVENAAVTAVVLENFKDDKVIVFKKKRRKQYKRTTGHRQHLTRIKIEEILTGKAAREKKPVEAIAPAAKEDGQEMKAAEKVPAARDAAAAAMTKSPAKKAAAAEKKTPAKPKPAKAEKKTAPKPKAEESAATKTAAPKAKPKAGTKPKTAAKPKAEGKPADKTARKAGEVKE